MRIRIVLALSIALAAITSLGVTPAAAQVDTWRVLHIGFQSGASVDTDGDGVVNTWGCKRQGNSGKVNCKQSDLYRAWQTDVGCFEQTVEAWANYQIDLVQEHMFIATTAAIENDFYAFHNSGLAAQYGFEGYDVVVVWTAFTQATGAGGETWNGSVVGTGYSYIGIYAVNGFCPAPGESGSQFDPPHEFVHTVVGLYQPLGYAVCPTTYEYPYHDYGEWDGHTMILRNTFPAVTCSNGVVSTGIPPEAFATGSWMDHY